MQILLANPRGFCAGVNMAIDALEKAVEYFGPNIFVYHEIVHNKYVVDRFSQLGVTFVDDVAEVPEGSILLYSAHGVSPEIREQSRARDLRTIDATCPLVTKVHLEAIRYAKRGYNIVLIGHEGHDEVIGTMGEAPESITLVETPEEVDALPFTGEDKIAVLTQTTLSVEEANSVLGRLRERYPQIETPKKEDICYATTNRQDAVKVLSQRSDLVLVLGSQNSSNSQRLRELGETCSGKAFLIDGASELQPEWFESVDTVLITAGASAPEIVVQEVIDHIKNEYGATVTEETIRTEHVEFPLPKELRQLQVQS
ncbi:4-hydroxy-3-methylbut-2-enyl diphosphate reductase [Calycomorphotria hydatis]|uniref:4-hydroxy-3-methylbut-2-enyl diphosphate reductase n=1 Tax=Calycomorphotria hydatis TaxID=2528027 RepID=A0A517TDA7_9PLAN|nr:4-hydroxy-3-methylbut-2-enyl diphosphate reductase [Calycomorphotria hydatis]QDT66358.1 4-hydroxy-3-methylbut-2-enyl diphosphate reductase [Calycomorphotria hydatis]